MPTFTYEQYHNPFVAPISALIQAPGQIEAQRAQSVGAAQATAAQQIGDAQARAAQASGQAYGNAAQQIGQSVAQQFSPEAQMQRLQMAQLQKTAADMKALDNAFSQPGGRDAILARLPGHLKPTVQAQFDSSDKAHADAIKAGADAVQATETADRMATEAFADTAAALKAHGYDPIAAQLALSDLKTKYKDNPQRLAQIQQAEAAIQKSPTPQTVQSLVDPLIQASPKRVELEQTAATHAETMRHDQETERISGLTQGREAAAAAETARHNAALEAVAATNATREQAAQAETARHNKASEATAAAAANPLGAMTGGAVSQGSPVHGDDFLKTLAPNIAGEVKAYAEGRRPFPTGMSYAKLEPLIQLVGQYDPTFDAGNFNARNKARTDLTSPNGQGGKIINSLNTAIQHAGKLSDLIEALGNSDYPAANYVANLWSKETGGTKVTNFEAVQPQLMKEIERLWRGAGGSEGDIAALKESLGKNMGIQQQREALDQFVGLMEGKLQSTEQQRDNVLGTFGKDVPILFDQSRPILGKIRDRSAGQAAGPKVIRYDNNGKVIP